LIGLINLTVTEPRSIQKQYTRHSTMNTAIAGGSFSSSSSSTCSNARSHVRSHYYSKAGGPLKAATTRRTGSSPKPTTHTPPLVKNYSNKDEDDDDPEGQCVRRLHRRKHTTKWRTCSTLVAMAAVVLLSFFAHKYMQQFYFSHCKANVFRVIMLNKSSMCIHLHGILTFIEQAYTSVLDGLIRQTLSPLYKATSFASVFKSFSPLSGSPMSLQQHMAGMMTASP
jgi:hypothetical protein